MSSRENIQPRGSLQIGEAPTSNSAGKKVISVRGYAVSQCKKCLLLLTHCSSLASGSSLFCGCHFHAAL